MMEKQMLIKRFIPHVIAIVVMIILPLLYATPVLKGKVLYQNDIIQGGGGSSELNEYREKTGEEALWTGTMFGGMPTFQMAIQHGGNLGYHINKRFRRLIAGPFSIIFICNSEQYYKVKFILLGSKGSEK